MYVAGQHYDPKNDPESAEFKERARVFNERDATSRSNAAQRGIRIKGAGTKDAFAKFGGKAF
jgi:hypothetical protein